jgi:hypothetical protein
VRGDRSNELFIVQRLVNQRENVKRKVFHCFSVVLIFKAMRAFLQSASSLYKPPSNPVPLDSTVLFTKVETRIPPRSAPQTSRVAFFGRDFLQTPPSSVRPESLPTCKSSPLISYQSNASLSPLKRVKNPFPSSVLPLRAISASKMMPMQRRSDSSMSSPIRNEKSMEYVSIVDSIRIIRIRKKSNLHSPGFKIRYYRKENLQWTTYHRYTTVDWWKVSIF